MAALPSPTFASRFSFTRASNSLRLLAIGCISLGLPGALLAQSKPIPVKITITTPGTSDSDVPVILVSQGVRYRDFEVADNGTCLKGHAYKAGDSCTMDYKFSASQAGNEGGAVQMLDANGDVLGQAYISGIGTLPMIAFTGTAPAIPATLPLSTTFAKPLGMAVDAYGYLYVSDAKTEAVYQVGFNYDTGTYDAASFIQTIGSFSGPAGLAMDGAGNIFVVDTLQGTIEELASVTNRNRFIQHTVASGFTQPYAIAVDLSGNLFVSDLGTSLISEIFAVNGVIPQVPVIRSIGQNQTFPNAHSVAVDAGDNVFVATGQLSVIPGAGDDVDGIVSDLGVTAVAVDPLGNLLIAGDGAGAPQVEKLLASSGLIKSPYARPTKTILATIGYGGFYALVSDSNGNLYLPNPHGNIQKVDLLDPPALTLPATLIGQQSSSQSLFVTNTGNANLTFDTLEAGTFGPNQNAFLNSGTCSLATAVQPGESCEVDLTFAPQNGGLITGAMYFGSNSAAGGEGSAALSGIGIETAALTSPTQGATLNSPSETFSWTSGNSHGVQLLVGTKPGAYNWFTSKTFYGNSITVTNLPMQEQTVYVTLKSNVDGIWYSTSYTFTSASIPGSNDPVKSALVSPAPGSTLPGSNVKFTWSKGTGVGGYELRVGTTPGAYNIFTTDATEATSANAPAIPAHGEEVYVTLYSFINGAWQSNSYQFAGPAPPAVF